MMDNFFRVFDYYGNDDATAAAAFGFLRIQGINKGQTTTMKAQYNIVVIMNEVDRQRVCKMFESFMELFWCSVVIIKVIKSGLVF